MSDHPAQGPSPSGAAQRTEALRRIGQLLQVEKPRDGLELEVSGMIGHALGAARAGYAQLDGGASTLRIRDDWAAPPVACIAGNYSTELFIETINRLAAGQVIAVSDIAASPWLGGDAGAYASIGARAFIKVPVRRYGRLCGMLFVHADQPRDWSFSEVDFMREAAERLSAAPVPPAVPEA
jgi:GAF domain-containing protein